MPFLPEPLSAGQVDVVVSAGVEGDVFEPRFTTHGFQYVRVEGHPGPLAADDITGVVVHTDLERTRRLRLRRRPRQPAARRPRSGASAATPATSRPTAPPASAPAGRATGSSTCRPRRTSTTSRGFSAEVAARPRRRASGTTATSRDMAPMPVAEKTGFLEKMNGSAGWGDAVVLVPWELYAEYGDVGDRSRRSGRPWCAGSTASRGWPRVSGTRTGSPRTRSPSRTSGTSGTPASTGASGSSPAASPTDFPAFIAADKSDVATAFYAWYDQPRGPDRVGAGREAEAASTPSSALGALDAWRTEFVAADGRDHAAHAGQPGPRAALRPRPRRAPPARGRRPRDAGPRGRHPPGTGFLSTPDLLPVLADHGHLDLAYELLLQDTEPSWLAHDRRAAPRRCGSAGTASRGRRRRTSRSTTTRRARSSRSCTGTSRGCSGSSRPGDGSAWSHGRVAGSLGRQTEHVSPHGPIAVAWSLDGRCSRSTSSSRPAASPRWSLPDGTEVEVAQPGRHRFHDPALSATRTWHGVPVRTGN